MAVYSGRGMTEWHRLIYAAHETPARAVEAVAGFMRETGRNVRALVVLSRIAAEQLVSQITQSDAFVAQGNVNETGTVFALSLARTWGRLSRWESSGEVLAFESAYPHAYYFLSDYDGNFWRNVLSFAIRKCYPTLSAPSISTEEIQGLLQGLADRFDAGPDRFRITNLSYNARIVDPHARKDRESDSSWTDRSLGLVFQQAREEDWQVTRVQFEILGGAEGSCRGHVTCDGEMGFSGEFDVLRELLLQPVARMASEIFVKLDNRERLRERSYATQPFFIEFADDILISADARAHLLAALSRMPHTSQSVIHANPYLHVSILDYLEDTSCELYVLSPSRISIVPQTRTSPTSLARLCAHIAKEFGEGRVVDYSEVY